MEEWLDRYKNSPIRYRLIGLAIVALVWPVMTWFEDNDQAQQELTMAVDQESRNLSKLRKAERKVRKLPELEQQLSDVEDSLEVARKILPKKIEFDALLSKSGALEKELNVRILHFAPRGETQPNEKLRYVEVPVELKLEAGFNKTMMFLDRMVHLKSLTHLRGIRFEGEGSEGEAPTGTTVATAELILFKSME